jgi:hypothetical protein
MTNEQITQAAAAAIRAMSPEARAAFIAMVEAGKSSAAQTVAQAYAVEGVSRQVRMASMALESSNIMSALTDVVSEKIAA